MIIEGYIVVIGVSGAIMVYRKIKGKDNDAIKNKLADRFLIFFLTGTLGMGVFELINHLNSQLLGWWNL